MIASTARVTARLPQGVRGMATEKQIFNRIQSTTSIAKITKSMKMVSASKLRGDKTRLEFGRPFAAWTQRAYAPSVVANEDERGEAEIVSGQDNMVVAITSDRGLCGGVNSFTCKAVMALGNELEAQDKNVKIQVFGDKGRPQMRRLMGHNVVASASDVSKNPYNFAQTSAMAMEVLKHDFDTSLIVYNRFISAIAYSTEVLSLQRHVVPTEPGEGEDPMVEYEFEPENKDEVLADMFEYGLACSLYGAVVESATSEQSARMTAMENATKNAHEMIDALTLAYNRARQSRITTELIEIISGASAIEDSS